MILLAGLLGCEDNNTPDTFGTAPAVGVLSISPPSATLDSTNTYAVFEAHGGTPPYSWSVSDSSLGSIPNTSASVITYTRVASAAGANVLTVEDRNRWTASAVINQE
jgi:hypothetical protein